MTTQTREFQTVTVLSLFTGMMLDPAGLGSIHELAEYVAGHSIFTHEFAMRRLWEQLKSELLSQLPALSEIDCDSLSKENFREWTAAAVSKLGTSMVVRQGTGHRTQSPLETLNEVAPGMPVIPVAVPIAEQN